MSAEYPEFRKLITNGSPLAVHENGTGDPVVLIHGGVSDMRTWHNQLPALSASYRTIAYSRRYARPNDDIADGVDDQMALHVSDLADLLRNLDAAPAHLVGHSWGGFIALLTAIEHPDLVRSLTLIEPPVITLFLDLPPKLKQVASLFLRAPRTALSILKLGGTVMAPAEKAFRNGNDEDAIKIFGTGVLGKSRFANLSPERYQQVWDNRRADKAQLFGAGFPALSEQAVRDVSVPVLLLGGAQSPTAFQRMNSELATLFKDARLTVVEDASHMVHEDAPEKTNRLILDFLSR